MSKPRATLFDYALVGINPALIMFMVGSLLYFLVAVCYQGEFNTRLNFIFAMFVMAIVCIARISIEQGTEYAALFAIPMGLVTFVALQRFVSFTGFLAPFSPVVNLALLGLTWWMAHKLTWDCTVLDESKDVSGEGLLQTAGLESGSHDAAATGEPAPTASDLDATTSRDEPAPDGWWARYGERLRRPHAPGVWVLYFAIVALPIFGLCQGFLSTLPERRYAFLLFWVYVTTSLSLLMTTSLLGLRRYLRQRNLEMPMHMPAVWFTVGAALVIGVLLACMVLPRPNPEYSIAHYTASSPIGLQTNNWGMFEGRQQDQATQTGQPDAQKNENSHSTSNPSDPSSSPSNPNNSQPSNRTESNSSQSNQNQSNPSQSNPTQANQAQSGQNQNPSNQGQSNQSQSNQSQSNQSQSSQSQSSQSQSSQSQSSQSRNQSNPSQGESNPSNQSQNRSTPDRSSENSSKTDPSSNPDSHRGSNSSQSQTSNNDSDNDRSSDKNAASQRDRQDSQTAPRQQASRRNSVGASSTLTQNRQSRPSTSASSPAARVRSSTQPAPQAAQRAQPAQPAQPAQFTPPTNLARGLLSGFGRLLQLFYWVAFIAIAGFLLWRYHQEIASFLTKLIDELKNLWERLFGGGTTTVVAVEEPVAPPIPPRPFSSFPNPFTQPNANQSIPQLLRYTFSALEALGREQGVDRGAEETPLEFAQRLGVRVPELARPAGDVCLLYSQLAYGNGTMPGETMEYLKRFWNLADSQRTVVV